MNKIIAIDCDGVLLNWEQSFDDWMAFQGFPKQASDHYDVSMNYHMNKGQCEVLVKIFNESAWMKFLKPIEGAVENIKKLADLGYKFHVITSQTLDKKANQLREENLKTVFDPEIPVNIYELGLIYDIKVNKENVVDIKMTLTTPNCPVAESLPKEVEESVKEIKEVKDAKLELVWDPPWDKSMMSEAAKLELNL